MAMRTICSSSETSNVVISINLLQWTIKSSCATKVIRIYEASGTDYLMEQTKTRFHTAELSTFSNNLHEAICYSQALSKKICTIFSVRSCPGKEF